MNGTLERPTGAVAFVLAPGGRAAYRGKLGCADLRCSQDGSPERCYGWHCAHCDRPSNCQADCTCPLPDPESGEGK